MSDSAERMSRFLYEVLNASALKSFCDDADCDTTKLPGVLSRVRHKCVSTSLHITLHQFHAIRPGVPYGCRYPVEAAKSLTVSQDNGMQPDVLYKDTKYLQSDRRRVLRTILICHKGTSVTSTKSRIVSTLPERPCRLIRSSD
jgi:hypothetical protein